MQERFALGEIDKEIYEKVGGKLKQEKNSIEEEIKNTKIKLSNLDKYTDYTLQLAEVLGNLSYYYSTATLENKQKLVGSIFPEKLIFSENTYRIAQPSELIEHLYYVNTELKKEKATKIGNLSY